MLDLRRSTWKKTLGLSQLRDWTAEIQYFRLVIDVLPPADVTLSPRVFYCWTALALSVAVDGLKKLWTRKQKSTKENLPKQWYDKAQSIWKCLRDLSTTFAVLEHGAAVSKVAQLLASTFPLETIVDWMQTVEPCRRPISLRPVPSAQSINLFAVAIQLNGRKFSMELRIVALLQHAIAQDRTGSDTWQLLSHNGGCRQL